MGASRTVVINGCTWSGALLRAFSKGIKPLQRGSHGLVHHHCDTGGGVAYFYRLGAAILLLLTAAMWAAPAEASFPPTSTSYYYFNSNTSSQSGLYTTTAALSASVYTWFPGAGAGAYCNFTSATFCEIRRANGTYYGGSSVAQYSASACPANSTLSGGVCSCNSGFNESGSSCVAQQVCDWAKNKQMVVFGTVELPRSNPTICQSGCHFAIPAEQGSVDGLYWKKEDGESAPYFGNYPAGSAVGSGAECSGTEGQALGTGPATVDAPATQTPPPAPKCQAGYIEGTATFNGVTTTICTPAISTENTDTKTTTKDTPSGPEVTTTNDVTVCTGAGSCTTTTTTSVSVNGGTPTTSTTSTTQGKQEYCAANKGKPECGDGSGSWSGDCVAGFQGEGDPVLVALSKEVHRQDCLLNKQTTEAGKYADAATKTGNQTANLPGNQTINIGSGNFDSSDAIGGASCIGDKTVVVAGVSVTLPFSTVCPWLGYLKSLLLAVSFIAAAGIVFRR